MGWIPSTSPRNMECLSRDEHHMENGRKGDFTDPYYMNPGIDGGSRKDNTAINTFGWSEGKHWHCSCLPGAKYAETIRGAKVRPLIFQIWPAWNWRTGADGSVITRPIAGSHKTNDASQQGPVMPCGTPKKGDFMASQPRRQDMPACIWKLGWIKPWLNWRRTGIPEDLRQVVLVEIRKGCCMLTAPYFQPSCDSTDHLIHGVEFFHTMPFLWKPVV